MAKKYEDCSEAERLAYVDAYFATGDLLTDALFKFDLLATDAPTIALRSHYRAQALTAQREHELLKNKRRAFRSGIAKVNPPSKQAVDAAVKRTEKLAAIIASQATANAIIDLVTKGLESFAKIQA